MYRRRIDPCGQAKETNQVRSDKSVSLSLSVRHLFRFLRLLCLVFVARAFSSFSCFLFVFYYRTCLESISDLLLLRPVPRLLATLLICFLSG